MPKFQVGFSKIHVDPRYNIYLYICTGFFPGMRVLENKNQEVLQNLL